MTASEHAKHAGRKRRAWRFGRWAESICIMWLRLKGYRILARDARFGVGELDVVARRGQWLVFVEVKGRNTPVSLEIITAKQRGRIVRAAGAFLARYPHLAPLNIRFDVMLLQPWQLPRHVTDAWRPDD